MMSDGLVNNSFFVKAPGIPQDTPNGTLAAEQINWAKIWVARFPDFTILKLLAQSLSYMYLADCRLDRARIR